MTTKSASISVAAALAVVIGVSATVTAADGPATTEHEHMHPPGAGERLGAVHFPVSCNPEAKERFRRAIAMLHSFWYEEAVKAFSGVADADPGCPMAWWGVAMSHWYPLWYPPPPAALKAGAEAVAKAEAVGATTERERGYIAAIAAFYRDSDKLDHRTRALAYEQGMANLHERYPDDLPH